MDRKEFIRSGCIACIGMAVGASTLQSCFSLRPAAVRLVENGLMIDLKEFDNGKEAGKSYVVVRHEDLQYPICVYKIDKENYTAVWMSCSHQGAELQVAGEQLTCPAHGSEFDRWGKVTQGPAAMGLRTFPVMYGGKELSIDLRKQW